MQTHPVTPAIKGSKMVTARLFIGKELVVTESFSDYNATHKRNPDWRATGAARALNYFVPTGTYGWQEWAANFLKEGESGVIQTSGPRGVDFVSIPARPIQSRQ